MKVVRIVLAVGAMLMLAGCREFFVPINSGGGGGSTTTGDYVYVANANTSTAGTIAGFSISSSGSLSAVTNSPYSLGYVPTALAITPNNKFLYVAGAAGLYVYSINSDGSLTTAVGGQAQPANVVAQSMVISPDGNWLLVAGSSTMTLSTFQINSTTGALSNEVDIALPTNASNPSIPTSAIAQYVTISPNGNFVFVALGTGGDVVYPFNTSTGALGSTFQLLLAPANASDNGLAVGPNSTHLYIARSSGVSGTGGLAVYSIASSNGALTAVSGSPYAAGIAPYAVAFDGTGNYIYAVNQKDNNIYGFSVASGGVLTALSGSPYNTGTKPIAILKDNSAKYMLVASTGGSPDLQLFGFDSTTAGKLVSISSSTTGTDPTNPIAMAATH
ncbi:MAG: lactonase family protein [Acidobacteriaceae bacterium]